MSGKHMGTLHEDDPLFDFLATEVLGCVLGFEGVRPIFDVYCLDFSKTVFRYADRKTFVNVVCKFYGSKWIAGSQTGNHKLRAQLMHREYKNLKRLRKLGLNFQPHYVVRPLAINEAINCVLVEEFAPGIDLEKYIRGAVHTGQSNHLRERLTDLAWFLADLHNRTQTDDSVKEKHSLDLLNKYIEQLAQWNITTPEQHARLKNLHTRWRDAQILGTGKQVLIHGDAVPPNFIFHGEHGLAVIDVERVWPGDCAIDLGCVAAELKHLFFMYSHDPWASEPYIQHFYEYYYSYLHVGIEDFTNLTTRGRFFMGCYELRIGRNDGIDLYYRRQLIDNAVECLNV